MKPIDFIIIGIIIAVIGGAVFFIVREKKRGKKCIGCPYSESCGAKCSCCCGSEIAQMPKADANAAGSEAEKCGDGDKDVLENPKNQD